MNVPIQYIVHEQDWDVLSKVLKVTVISYQLEVTLPVKGIKQSYS